MRWCGRCSRSSTTASTTAGARRWPPTSATSRTARRRSCGRGGATPWRAGSPGCSRPMPGSARSCSSTGATAAPATSTPTCDWQPQLWRALLDRVDADPPHIRHAKTVARLQESPTDLPQRLSLFGHTRLPITEIELLDALATHHDLHLWLPHPSDDLWRSLAGVHGPIPRRDDTSHREVGHPLLATLGRDLRELQRSLPADPQTDEYLGGRRPPRHAAGLAAVRHRRQRRSAARAGRCTPTTARSRCTAATARPARSTCCARCCSACSPTTRRWSRATSSSCARTSRPMPR